MEEGLIHKKSVLQEPTLADFFHQCYKNGLACALYRLPQSSDLHMIIDISGGHNLEKVEIEQLSSGFVFHPFSSSKHPIKFLFEDIHLMVEKGGKFPEIIHSSISEDEIVRLFKAGLPTEKKKEVGTKNSLHENFEKDNFLNLIRKTINEIERNKFQKAVISRKKVVTLPDQFDPVILFDALCDRYINAFIHLTYIPGCGTWTGATPETLINIDKQNQFQTVALAATQSFNKSTDLGDTTWSQKDIEEQAMVSRYIINCFKKIRLREFEEIGPRTYLSGNLVHLKTNYRVDMDLVAFPELGSVMLDLLHPTSAVCGMPKEETQIFIEENEGFDREYFSGFLGPVNVLGETNIFVNLRCAKLDLKHASLFAGAGIIANSVPEKEWKETELKMDTLLSVINSL
jgi:isochorismate synthase